MCKEKQLLFLINKHTIFMAKKLTSTAFSDNGFTAKVNKPIIKWVVQNQTLLKNEYESNLVRQPRVRFCLDLRTLTGSKIGLTVKNDGSVSFTPYVSAKKSVDWDVLQEMGCPSNSK